MHFGSNQSEFRSALLLRGKKKPERSRINFGPVQTVLQYSGGWINNCSSGFPHYLSCVPVSYSDGNKTVQLWAQPFSNRERSYGTYSGA